MRSIPHRGWLLLALAACVVFVVSWSATPLVWLVFGPALVLGAWIGGHRARHVRPPDEPGDPDRASGERASLVDIPVLDDMRGDWAALVVHDLQQPMNAILLGLDVMLRGPLGVSERLASERIRGSAERLSRMIGDLRGLSELDGHRVRLHRRDVDLLRFARDVVDRCPDIVDRVAIRAPAGPVMVSCDPDRLEQVMTNLLSNAAKYGDGSEIAIEVERDAAHAKISISNRGMGIPTDEINSVFERNVRTRAARGSMVPGSGLGLYIARGLVEAHGGRIWASSVPGGRTSFHVELPAPSDRAGLAH